MTVNETNAAAPVRRMLCCCCGAVTRGRQWHNRDTGYGVCAPCIARHYSKETPAELERLHGVAGVHYSIEELRAEIEASAQKIIETREDCSEETAVDVLREILMSAGYTSGEAPASLRELNVSRKVLDKARAVVAQATA